MVCKEFDKLNKGQLDVSASAPQALLICGARPPRSIVFQCSMLHTLLLQVTALMSHASLCLNVCQTSAGALSEAKSGSLSKPLRKLMTDMMRRSLLVQSSALALVSIFGIRTYNDAGAHDKTTEAQLAEGSKQPSGLQARQTLL